MGEAANSAGEVIEVEDEQEEDYDPAWNEADETNEEKEAENVDESAEVIEENAADEGDEGEDAEDADEEENDKEDEKVDRPEDEAAVNEIFETSKVKLTDGTEAPMISRGPLYPEVHFIGIWPFNCHLCGMHGIRNLNALKKHLESLKHKSLLKTMPLDAKNYKEGMHQVFTVRKPKYNNLIKILPGERIAELTPEYHDRILPVQERYFVPRPPEFMYIKFVKTEPLHIYNKKQPILGLSYCFKNHYFNTFSYYCSLCDVQCGQSAYQHFIGFKHRSRYADSHFPRLVTRITGYLSDVEDEKAKQKITYELIRKIYRTIEDKRGLREVHMVDRVRIFPRRCVKFCNKIVHYGDNHVLTTDDELKEMIEKCKKGETLLEPDPLNPPFESERAKARALRAETDPSSKRSHSRREESPPINKAPRLADNANNWDRYRRMLGAALDDIDERYADYERIPEKHPAYEEEWKKFWNRRVREIEQDGLNPDDYDFKTEWIPYWKEIMKKYHTTSISKTKFRIKKSLRLPFDKRSPSPIRKQRSQRRKRSPSPERPSRRRRTRSPRSTAPRSARRRESPPAIAKPMEPPGVISVLRLLTALEDNLGSLGPKALEYLSKSLLYEKDNDQNANQLLLNQEYYVFFVTAKEKLKGQLIANLVDKPKYKAVTHVIEEIETLIEMFDDFCKRTGRTVTATPQSEHPQERPPTSSKQQGTHFNDDDQYGGRSQEDYNRSRQQGFDRSRDDDGYDQRRGGEMDQYRNSAGYNSQYGRSQTQYDTAGGNQYDDDAPNPNQYGQNRSMSSNQGSGSNQYSRGGQGGVWQSGTNMTFRNNANNPGADSSPVGGNYGNYGNNGNQGNQGNYRSDRDGNLSGSYGDRGGSYNSNLASRGGGGIYNSSMAIRGGNSSSLGRGGSFNSPQGDAGDNQGYRSGNNYSSGNFNSGYSGNNQGRNMAPPEALMNKPLGNYGGGYGRSSMNTRGYGGGN